MSSIFEFEGVRPVIHKTAFVHPNATVTGNVIIGKEVYIGPGAAIRGDFGKIIIEDGCNVQENCTIHMFPGVTVLLKKGAHIGHGAIIHGAIIGENVLVGMNSVIMDNTVIGNNCIIGALTMVPSDMNIPDGKVVVGNPGKIIKDVSEDMLTWKTEGTKIYQQLTGRCHHTLFPCEPLAEPINVKDENSALKRSVYKPWQPKKTK
jgi:phenylacetic acid degradation protein